MNRSVASVKSGSEPISGYVLRRRLGAGGYGEVWLADAPGGLQKAVKLIYGTVDESHASSELKSLQRIKQVYHPFLLSIERIEVTDGQVAIVTELAESSLLDRFEQFRRRGSPGIPRAMLLDFLRDTADALDFLSQKHSLQHLDVKPGNLLIVADRIKVADFGLIKDLHDQNQSLVSGLTPTYSAPEIFDGRPDYRSDQYSLAIVYTEMLTGKLPFSGSTTGELARQHISQSPDLESLPPADRPAVARALSKNPLDRFATCRQFVERLLKTKSAVIPVGKAPETQSREEASTAAPVTASTMQAKRKFMPGLDTSAIRNSWQNSRAMFIGLGGVGSNALLELHQLVSRDCDNRLTAKDHRWLAIDTDIDSLDELTMGASESQLPSSVALQLPIYRPSEYRDAPPDLFTPLSRRWLYNIPRSQRTEGVRPLAILSFLDHYPQLRAKLGSELHELVKASESDEASDEPIRIYALSSLHGGTGSALLQEFGFLVRRIMSDLGFHNYQLIANVTAATTINGPRANLPAAAALACLSELDYSMNRENESSSIYYEEMVAGSNNQTPFDWVTIVDGGLHGNSEECAAAVKSLAELTWVDSQSMVGAALSESRRNWGTHRHWLRAAAVSPIDAAVDVSEGTLARWCCEQSLTHALHFLTGVSSRSNTLELNRVIANEDGIAPTVSGDLPLTDDACGDFLNRYLAEVSICSQPKKECIDGSNEANSIAEHKCWKRRLSSLPEERASQLQEDFHAWCRAILKLLKVQIYHWHQIERLQVTCIQGMLDTVGDDLFEDSTFFAALAEQGSDLTRPKQLAAEYMKALAQQCLKFFDHFQKVGKDLTKKTKSWCESINAEKSLNERGSELSYQMLSPELQNLTTRINSILGASLTRLMGDSISGVSENDEEINLAYLLKLSQEILEQNKAEMNVSAKDFSTAVGTEDGSRSLQELEDFAPSLSAIGGEVYRLIVCPQEQLELVGSTLSREELNKTTTVIAGTRSMGIYALSDATGIAMHSLVGSLWRPSVQTLQLAERVRTRVDVEWEPVATLLEFNLEAEPFPLMSDSDGLSADGSDNGEGTSIVSMPINLDLNSSSPGSESPSNN